MICRNCKKIATQVFADLDFSPPSNSFLTHEQLNEPETYYPLKVLVCGNCYLVQVDEHKSHESIFNESYAYFSSYSASWLKHAEDYTSKMIQRLNLGSNSFVVEVASNDGYLLKNFVEASIPCLGVEPTHSTAKVAREAGVPTVEKFFGKDTATHLISQYGKADLMLGNNVLAHVPDIHDFISGFSCMLKPEGVVTFEFPHLLRLIQNNQFDTIYHEHFSYLTLDVVQRIFSQHGLRVFDVDELSTHGGSLRVYGCLETAKYELSPAVQGVLSLEMETGLQSAETYSHFQDKIKFVKNTFLEYLITANKKGLRVAAYGAAAKGNTLINYAGIKKDLLQYVVDASPFKIGSYLPGSHIPVVGVDHLKKDRPDVIVVLPWNLYDEIDQQLSAALDWKYELVRFIPELKVVSRN